MTGALYIDCYCSGKSLLYTWDLRCERFTITPAVESKPCSFRSSAKRAALRIAA